MKLKFEANQDFQIEAINSIVGIFEGQPKIKEKAIADGLLGIYANQLNLSNEEILGNIRKTQEKNQVSNDSSTEELDFSIEMETGTGKTYVYLRTIFELNLKYGWTKFIILVPSVAIREGVIKTLQITKEHFKELYNNIPYRFYEYQSKNVSQVKHFADSSNIEIMVMTIGAFNKDSNVLYSEIDQMHGEQPINYIQKTNPILILDEPQNMEGEATKEGLKKFNSLFRLRYSATHKNPYNLAYQLSPYHAYELGLVKKIDVYSVIDDEEGLSHSYLNLIDVASNKSIIKAKLEVLAKDEKGNIKKKTITVKQGEDLAEKANNRLYNGYIVEDMTANAPDFGAVGSIRFRNNVEIRQGEDIENDRSELIKKQISETIKLHFKKRQDLKKDGIKVLSLFFIDKVDNYIKEDGLIRTAFINEFNRLKKEYKVDTLSVEKIHKGYFAMKDDEYLDREKSIAENKEAYELIMKDKERLLSFDEPTEFIFSHSALKEGWDNPNVFNICTLNTTYSAMKKRQEIGRGMRLCVNQEGERVFSRDINLLSVIANESYAHYVSQLQNEFEEDGIYQVTLPKNAKNKTTVKLKKDFSKDKNFNELWSRISKKTKYMVRVDAERLLGACIPKIKALAITKPQIKVERVGINIGETGITAKFIGQQKEDLSYGKKTIDCIEFIKNETRLTKRSIAEMLKQANNLKSFFNNPERFSFEVARIIKEELTKAYIEQISYEATNETYAANEFSDIQTYTDSMQTVDHSIYDAIVFDSNVEKTFALDLDHDERIKLFLKMPNWYKVTTPVGTYNPDWAIVTVKRDLQGNESKEKVYFVLETKGNLSNLRTIESAKIHSAKKHFEAIQVSYREVENYEQFSHSSQ